MTSNATHEFVQETLAKRRDRCIAIMLGMKERECDEYLPLDVQTKMRKVILDQMNDFFSISLDILNSLDSGEVILNQAYLDKLDAIYAAVAQ